MKTAEQEDDPMQPHTGHIQRRSGFQRDGPLAAPWLANWSPLAR